MKITKQFKQILPLFIFWRLGLLLATYLGTKVVSPSYNGGLGAPTFTKNFDYWLSWAQWDGGYYFSIAQRGYLFIKDYAFFPLYPILIHYLEIFGLGLLASGLIISNVSFIVFLIIFYKFLQENYSVDIAKNTVITFLAFPTTFFAVAYYSEGLFLMFAAATFLFLGEKKYLGVSITIILASLTRFAGSFLIVSFIYHYSKSISFDIKKISSTILFVIFSAMGIFVYSLYQFYRLNNPIGFISTQTLWQREINDPASTIVGHIFMLVLNPNPHFDQYFDIAVTLLFLGLLIGGVKKIKSSLWIFSMLVILIPSASGTLTSMSRYALGSLGAFIVAGEILSRYPKLRSPIWAASLALQAILATRFITGYWVA